MCKQVYLSRGQVATLLYSLLLLGLRIWIICYWLYAMIMGTDMIVLNSGFLNVEFILRQMELLIFEKKK